MSTLSIVAATRWIYNISPRRTIALDPERIERGNWRFVVDSLDLNWVKDRLITSFVEYDLIEEVSYLPWSHAAHKSRRDSGVEVSDRMNI